MFNKLFLAGLAALITQTVLANENFVTQSTTPYPPACMSTGDSDNLTPSDTRRVYASDIIKFSAWQDSDVTANVEVEIYRRGCSDPDRSVLFFSAQKIDSAEGFYLPRLFAKIGEDLYPLRLVNEPNSFEQNQNGFVEGTGFNEYILDGVAASAIESTANIITPDQYNAAFTLVIRDALDDNIEYEVGIDAFSGLLKPRKFPMNGRLSGVWVVEGARDQGFVIAFNEFVDSNGVRGQMFLSWYTYNTDGSTLWLVANTFHDIPEDSVDLNMELVENGEFLTSKQAERTPVGNATLTAENCNELTFEYNLDGLGLGSGTITLVRAFSVETAGFACRDQAARIDAL